MRKTRSRRRAGKPPSATRPEPRLERIAQQYKVVELSTVDEVSLEQTLNLWVSQAWQLESIQFAMRESSKRPAMAFVLFTRPRRPDRRAVPEPSGGSEQRPLAESISSEPWRRLRELAGEEPTPVHPLTRRPG
jgi:hypothetical protein